VIIQDIRDKHALRGSVSVP